jgi:ABC-2 type transport system ATP-binding protein
MTDTVIAMEHVSKSIAHKQILTDISVRAERGAVIGLVGKNGAGKSTLMDVLLGFSPASSGHASLFGKDSFTLPATLKGRIGFVPQQDELVDFMTGQEQVALTAALCSTWNPLLVQRLAREWQVPMDRRIRTLSVGERQKLSTIVALGHEPDLLVLDEPAASLDPLARRQLLAEILEITGQQQRTVLFSTHIVSDLERVASDIWILREGQLAWSGGLDELKETVVRIRLGSQRDLPARLPIEHALSQRVAGMQATAVVTHWNEDAARQLSAALHADIAVERLGLEDLFVEFHA